MKILIASDLHYPTINGVATFSRNLAKGLAARGHDVLVVAPSQTGKKYKEVDGNHPIYRTVSVPFPFYQNFRISLNPNREVKKIISDFEPDVIHIQMLLGVGQAAMKCGNRLGIPVVSTNHAMPENLLDNLRLLAPVSRPINYILREYGRRFHNKSDYVTTPTQSAIDMFRETEKMTVPFEAISNGIDLSRFTPGRVTPAVRQKFSIPNGKSAQVITYIGRLDAEKHISVLVRAFAELVKHRPSAHLLIVGDGTDRDNLERLSADLGLSAKVTFTGRVSDEELLQLHRAGDVFAMPSPAELQSIATLEAMASGQPVVAVDAGALSELCKNEVNGYLCEQDNIPQLVDALTKVLKSPTKRKKFGEESSRIAATHDIEYTLEKFENVYSHLIKSKI